MPVHRAQGEVGDGEPPKEPHFSLMVNQEGHRLAIPPGASMWIVEDPSNPDKVFPLFLKQVSHNKLVFCLMNKDPNGGPPMLTDYIYRLESAKLHHANARRLKGQRQKPKR